MTLIKTEYLAHRHEVLGVPFRTRLFGGLPNWVEHYRGLVRVAVTLRNLLPPVAWAAEKWLGLTAKRRIPKPAALPFDLAWREGTGDRGEVILLVDTFAHHFEPEIARAASEVLARCGYRVKAARPLGSDAEPERPLCCGRTYLSMGLVDQAKVEGKRLLDALLPAAQAGIPIVGLEPSCLLSLRDELYSLGLGADVGVLGKQLFLFEEFLVREVQRNGLKLPVKALESVKAKVHGHCHQKAFGVMKSLRKLLEMLPGVEFELIEASCCGMAGSFGIEAEHYEASMAMAELSLLPAIRQAAPTDLVIADGFSCRHQIDHGAGRKATHVALLVQRALA